MTGIYNTGVGAAALAFNTGSDNTAAGAWALANNKSAVANTAVGARALQNNDSTGHSAGDNNSAFGSSALFNNTDGYDNTAIGDYTLVGNTIGHDNTAIGHSALIDNTASGGTAVGSLALFDNTSGVDNTAVGFLALARNLASGNNTAVGTSALGNAKGGGNTAIGSGAGLNSTTGSFNVYIGEGVEGSGSEHSHTYIRNINTTVVNGAGTDTVTVNLATGLLGHRSSSRRYKEDIKPMSNTSEALYQLKPVTYRYKKEIDRTQSLDYGLIAEEVAKVDPNLAVSDGKGQIEGVRYDAVNAMLLNEFLKEHSTVQELKKEVAALTATVKEQAAQIQKVSAELELTKRVPQVVLNNR
jgi:hypothetical protein